MQSYSTKDAGPSSGISADQNPNPLLGDATNENEVSHWSPSSSSAETITNEEHTSSAHHGRTQYDRSSSLSTTSTVPILERAAAERLPSSTVFQIPAESQEMIDALASGPSTPPLVIPDPIPPQYYSRSHSCSLEEQEYFQYQSRGGRFLRARARHFIDGASELSKRVGRILKNLGHSGLLDLDRDDGVGRSRTYHIGGLPPAYQSQPEGLYLISGATTADAGASAGVADLEGATQGQGQGQPAPVMDVDGVHLSRAGRLRNRIKRFGRNLLGDVKLMGMKRS